jgi:diadenosine tetraphosphate (Ap4A) HIT family hydrolase
MQHHHSDKAGCSGWGRDVGKSLLGGAMCVFCRKVAKDLANQEGIESIGYRLVMNCGYGAGQVVNHLHLHLLGGWEMG